MIMKTEESLYIKILLWAYDNSVNGFTERELFDHFDLNDKTDLKRWYVKVFKNGTNDNPSIIDHFTIRNEVGYWCLTEKGMSAAIAYLDLKEARESSKEAKKIALWSIWIAIIVGVFQILIGILQLC